ncbi:MAG: hypothetical protein QOE01_1078, partial [Actinomycetota bacterium]|nr:hypothetical protein [Actinomycetota bacterium]
MTADDDAMTTTAETAETAEPDGAAPRPVLLTVD